jgi:hypothetical protein
MLHRENGKKLLYTHALGKGLERREELELIVDTLTSKCLALHHTIGTVQPESTAIAPLFGRASTASLGGTSNQMW